MSDERLRAALDGYTSEALTLRFAADPLPGSHATPQQILGALTDTRRRLDRLEELLGFAIRLRAATHRVHAQATATHDDAWDAAVVDERNAPVARGGDYTSARERHAYANLAVLDHRHTQRRAADLLSSCDEAVDLLKLTHRGLDGVRHDLGTILRTITFESTLER